MSHWTRAGRCSTVADFTGDGLPDGATLRPKGTRGAVIDLFMSDGSTLRRSVAWKSDRAGFEVGSVTLASGDINDDGFAELLALAPYGRTGAQILSFTFGENGAGRRSVYRSKRAGVAVAGARLDVCRLNGDGTDDAMILGRSGGRTVLQGLSSHERPAQPELRVAR